MILSILTLVQMNKEEIINLYDKSYAETYNYRFLTEEPTVTKTVDELKVIQTLLKLFDSSNWLDIACGTGFYLSQFPDHKRVGLDLSPDMLEVAKSRNKEVLFYNNDYKNGHTFEADQFDVITSLWWAYTFVDKIDEIDVLISNIRKWLKPDGICFLPVCDISRNLLLSTNNIFPYYPSPTTPVYGGMHRMEAVIWSYFEENGKIHRNLLVPHIDKMKEMFNKHFNFVEIITYCNGNYKGILASNRKFDPYGFLSSSIDKSFIK